MTGDQGLSFLLWACLLVGMVRDLLRERHRRAWFRDAERERRRQRAEDEGQASA
jgi:hypothetical protein